MLELLRESWAAIEPALRERAGHAVFDAWLADLRPLALERSIVHLEAKSKLVCHRVERLYKELIEELLSAQLGTRIGIELVPAPESVLPERLEVGPTQPVVDGSNRTAFLVLSALLEGKPLPSRLILLHGPSGVGKTFLLRWWRALYAGPVMEHDGEGLVKAFGACLRDGRVGELRAELERSRPLILDELHRVSGRARLQRELCGVLEARERLEVPTLVASRWHPREVWRLEPALRSRLLAGFVTRVDPPGLHARLQFLRALVGAASRNGRAEDVEKLARELRGTYGDLRRAWVARREGLDRHPGYLRLIQPRTTFDTLCERVVRRSGVSRDELLGRSQARRVSLARQVLAWLCVQEGLTRAEVGRYLGGRSRASIAYGLKALEKRLASSPEVRRFVEMLQ